MRRETLLDFFEDFADLSDLFLVYDDGLRIQRRTYRETAQTARALAARLREAGVRKGDKVVFWSENRPEWIAALWACLLLGAIAVPVDYRASAAFLLRIRDRVGAHIVWIGEEVAWPEAAAPRPWRFAEVDWSDTRETAAERISRDDIAEIVFTSGATADPKGVIITHRNILANVVPVETEIRKYRRWGRPFFPLRFLNLLPLSHMFGQAMATFIPPVLPAVVVFMRGHNPEEIVRQIHSKRISVLVSVPKILEILRDYVVQRFPEASADLPAGTRWPRRWWHYRRIHRMLGWKFWAFVVGAAPLAPDVEEFWSRLGFLTIQGYGLTETAPIVTLNHPFHARRGTVGTPIGGVEVKIAPDGEILVRGENVSAGYYGAAAGTREADDGWLHTGDIGSIDSEGRLSVRGRKKEMIVTPEGLNVFPEDVERVLDAIPGVKESAAVGTDRVHAVLVLEPGADAAAIVREANRKLEDHQRIQGVSVWPEASLPRTEGTAKLKRTAILEWVKSGGVAGPSPPSAAPAGDALQRFLAQHAAGRTVTPDTTLEELGLSSLERVELMIQLGVSEPDFQAARTVGDLASLREQPVAPAPAEELPQWPRSRIASLVRDIGLATLILPLARAFAWLRVEGRENLAQIKGPVIFASNHQSHFDGPSILWALPYRLRRRVAIAASREFFAAHFHPERFSLGQRVTSSLNFYLASLFFNIFPLPQREAGAMESLRYAGRLTSEGWSLLIFPEGVRTEAGEIRTFQPGVAMMAARLGVPVVPVRLEGLDRILHQNWRMPRPGRACVTFGAAMTLKGDDYKSLARRVEAAVREL